MKVLLLDANSLVNRAYYAMPQLRDSSGRPTGGVYGFVNMLAKLIAEEKPTHIACAFDVHCPTFRHKLYDQYKAGRHPTPEELVAQIPMLKQVLQAMGIRTVELPGYEADDIVGTLAGQADGEVIVVSGDRDLLQLVADNVTVYHTKRGITDVIKYTPARLAEEGLRPDQVPELKGLMGDSSDNLKGVAGVGEKTAKDLIAKYDNLDGLYSHIDGEKGKLREKLLQGKQDAYFCRDLATICRTAPIEIGLQDCVFDPVLPAEAETVLRQLDFKNLVGRFAYRTCGDESHKTGNDITVKEIATDEALQACMQEVESATRVCLALYKDVWHITADGNTEYRIPYATSLLEGLPCETVMQAVCELLRNPSVRKIVFDLKTMYYTVQQYLAPFAADDVMLASYVADALHTFANAGELVLHYGYEEEQIACGMWRVWEKVCERLIQEGTVNVYTSIELPLVQVLYDMEQQGFTVDVDTLNRLGEMYTDQLRDLSDAIYSYAGGVFNINSPKQLAEVLYDKLGLPTDKKRSTGADKLERLAELHPIVDYILRYRQLAKLQSTYVAGLVPLLDSYNKLHTVFKQALTATGRLSSTEPNLQNIPVRTPEGRELRRAFVPSAGNVLVVADYSQIELRLMAHFSKDAGMLEAYREGKDIHAATAAKVYGVPIEEVTHDMRSRCKAVNFGIIYGISDFGLSANIGCSVKQAKEFIEKYFAMYPGVKQYMADVVELAKKQGYVQTLSGRRRQLPELQSSVYSVRQFGERVAMNMPLQGTASDIIKLAMIRIADALKKRGLQAKMILQVHDELVIDTPVAEVEEVKQLVKELMENVFALDVPLVVEVGVGHDWVEAK